MRIIVVVGTRPGIIKLSPVIRSLDKADVGFGIAHTGQHYSYNMDQQFFHDLELPEPDYQNDVVKTTSSHGAQTGEMLKALEAALMEAKPTIVVVGGDANTNLAGALAARKLDVKVAHVEAGLRSHDWRMPEEHNRVMIDHISEYLFPPTEQAKENLIEDNVHGEILVTGNTVVDAAHENLVLAQEKSRIMERLGLAPDRYLLLTAHRQENVDDERFLTHLLKALRQLANEFEFPVVFPMHPRTSKRIDEFGMTQDFEALPGVQIIDPVGYLDFLLLLSNARLALTDSGGIQEEACILHVPCITLRESTERPETVSVGANRVAGSQPTDISSVASEMLSRDRDWTNPFGDGRAGRRIVEFLEQRL